MKSSHVLFGLLLAAATAAGAAESAVAKDADAAWAAVRGLGRPPPTFSAKRNAGTTANRTSEIAHRISDADKLRAFSSKYSQDPRVHEAKWRELSALTSAAMAGDETQDTRRSQLLEEIRNDSQLEESRRFEAVATSNQLSIHRQQLRDRPLYLAAQESATRSLIAEFPGVTYGYESLLAIARDSSPEKGKAVAQELMLLPGASPSVKSAAREVVDRFSVLGKPVDQIFAQAGASNLVRARENRVAVIYGWTSAAPQELRVMRQWAARTSGAVFIGICLDADIDHAKNAAASILPPGEQYYDSRGADGALAQALHIGRHPVVYLADRAGLIRDVQANDGFSAKIDVLLRSEVAP